MGYDSDQEWTQEQLALREEMAEVIGHHGDWEPNRYNVCAVYCLRSAGKVVVWNESPDIDAREKIGTQVYFGKWGQVAYGKSAAEAIAALHECGDVPGAWKDAFPIVEQKSREPQEDGKEWTPEAKALRVRMEKIVGLEGRWSVMGRSVCCWRAKTYWACAMNESAADSFFRAETSYSKSWREAFPDIRKQRKVSALTGSLIDAIPDVQKRAWPKSAVVSFRPGKKPKWASLAGPELALGFDDGGDSGDEPEPEPTEPAPSITTITPQQLWSLMADAGLRPDEEGVIRCGDWSIDTYSEGHEVSAIIHLKRSDELELGFGIDHEINGDPSDPLTWRDALQGLLGDIRQMGRDLMTLAGGGEEG